MVTLMLINLAVSWAGKGVQSVRSLGQREQVVSAIANPDLFCWAPTRRGSGTAGREGTELLFVHSSDELYGADRVLAI